MNNQNYLSGNIICATPQLRGGFFSKSIIYITHHDINGAAGIVLNYKLTDINGSEVFKRLDIQNLNYKNDFSIHLGGPMNQTLGFILYSKEYKSSDTMKITDYVNLTCSRKIMEDIAKNIGPSKFFISLGYSGWGPGQLENEFKENSWLHLSEKLDLIFDIESEQKWDRAIKSTGIDFSKFSNVTGHA